MRSSQVLFAVCLLLGCKRAPDATRVVPDAAPVAPPGWLPVLGRVVDGKADCVVEGRDGDGTVRAQLAVRADGHFVAHAPAEVIEWRARCGSERSAYGRRLPPGTGVPIVLHTKWKQLRIDVREESNGAWLASRIVIKGRDGDLDPSFGADFQSPGSGPIWDSEGSAVVALPPGKYRVYASKGIEWDLASADVVVTEDEAKPLALLLHHSVNTDGLIAADFHVHCEGSFDSHVTREARARSLAAAGIEFAVPTEHDRAGSYPERKDLRWAPGAELTPDKPSFGHVGAFPWRATTMPRTVGTTPDAFVKQTRALDSKALLVMHHPRFKDGIGYLNEVPGTRDAFPFDGFELMNGYASASVKGPLSLLADLEAIGLTGKHPFVTASSDSHKQLYGWAGYPRTYVQSASNEPAEVLAALRAGRTTLSAGPVVLFHADGKGPGNFVQPGRLVSLRAEVRAAAWVHIARVSFYAGGTLLQSFAVEDSDKPVRAIVQGSYTMPDHGFVTAVAEGTRNLGESLPFLDAMPLGIAGPVWIRDAQQRP